jgi:ADP-ribose pyrophosphatase YjhB (NUDIX family)
MTSGSDPRLDWSRTLLSIAQEGLTYAGDPFDLARYEKLRALAAEMAAWKAGEEPGRTAGLFAALEGYATPKVDVRGVVFRENRILLVSERTDGGRWTLPGGWADLGSTPAENVVREVREESGFATRAVRLLAVYDRERQAHPPRFFSAYKMFFLCEITGGGAAGSLETGGAEFFAEDGLPELSPDRTTEAQVYRMFELWRRPDRPADFD